jgi:hypothetical protein
MVNHIGSEKKNDLLVNKNNGKPDLLFPSRRLPWKKKIV